MNTAEQLQKIAKETIESFSGLSIENKNILITPTKPEFEGDYTLVLFPFIKALKKSPEVLGNEIGILMINSHPELFKSYNVISGFLNFRLNDLYWINFLQKNCTDSNFGKKNSNGKKIMLEYSSPNTNKPLHLGHLRNNFLGWSIAEILKANGYEVVKTCIVNDRGIHICKSMVAWQLFAKGETPSSANMKGDHFVGAYYVKFNDEYKIQVQKLVAEGMQKMDAEKEAPIMLATQQMLLDWEAGKDGVINLWQKMNSWVYDGFEITYKRIGTDFHKTYYESDTYLLGKKIVEKGIASGVFNKIEDGSVWIDLTSDGLDKKIVMRKDGTSVYITQDIGLAEQKFEEYRADESIYVVGDEQNYHFKVLKLIAQKLKLPGADGIFHLSYGMVELPTGRMKSREGTVVDADDLIDEMISIAASHTDKIGKVSDLSAENLKELYNTISLGALKFFLLRVDPKKKMIFNPEESIDFHGFTGPFVQYTHTRIKSILSKVEESESELLITEILPLERKLIIKLEQYGTILEEAAKEHNPSLVAIYAFEVAKLFNSFYAEHSVLHAETEGNKQFRIQLCKMTVHIIASATSLLGMKVPDRM
ncbi:MAG: arginine--tRNA ligase [Chitinophagaceae bacterium]|nr:MAG: arginine--tRNA ligase [Chitinophagaceae bacterium]